MKLTKSLLMLILLAYVLALTGCATYNSPAASSGLSCAEAGTIDAQVAPEAEASNITGLGTPLQTNTSPPRSTVGEAK